MANAATLKDVAFKAGVDRSTVSRVLRNDPALSIRPETRERILKAARLLRYQPDAIARGLKLRRTFTLGMLVPLMDHPTFPEMIRGAEQAAREAGYLLVLSHAADDAALVPEHLRLVQQNRVDGLLVATSYLGGSVVSELQYLGTPYIFVNRKPETGENYVRTSDESASRTAVRHLLELGHRRIVHLAGPLQTDNAQRRLLGYKQALKDFKVRFDPGLVEESGFYPEHGRDGMLRALRKNPDVTAVFGANIAVAAGALRTLRDQGIRVPEQMSVISIHDAPLAELVNPPLTTVKVPLFEVGYEAARQLVGMVEQKAEARGTTLSNEDLILRGSTAPLTARPASVKPAPKSRKR